MNWVFIVAKNENIFKKLNKQKIKQILLIYQF